MLEAPREVLDAVNRVVRADLAYRLDAAAARQLAALVERAR
jgi:hypothetical protein